MRFEFIGHMYDAKENHDKVWGVIVLSDDSVTWNPKCLTFWGRRGKKLQTQLGVLTYDTTKLIRAKVNKGYLEVDENKLNEVYPEFQSDLEKTAMWATLMA